MLEAALKYASLGYYVIPVKPKSKQPMTAHAARDASRDEKMIREWWSRSPEANVGIVALNCFIIDLDVSEKCSGVEEFQQYRNLYGIPDAPKSLTGKFGQHWFFALPNRKIQAGVKISINGEKTNIDIRTGYTFVVAPPSVHPNGNCYDWMQELVPVDKLPALPEGFLDAIGTAKKEIRVPEPVNKSIDQFKRDVRGLEVSLLTRVAGIPASVLDGKHHPCPKCGGKDRFRLINRETGAVLCNQCFREKNGDFLAAIQWMRGISLTEAMNETSDALGMPRRDITGVNLSGILNEFGTNSQNQIEDDCGFEIQDCDPLAARDILWTWKNHIPKGKLTIIAGRGSAGKSTFVTALAANVSKGGQWPDGEACEAGTILYFYSEDDRRDTLIPRFCAAGCEPENVKFLQFVKQFDARQNKETIRRFCLTETARISKLLNKFEKSGRPVRMIVFDPITGFLGAGVDSNKNSVVRELLTHLSNFGEEHPDVAILAIAHTKKGISLGDSASDTISGAGEFTNVARCVWNVYEDAESGYRVALASKWNLDKKPNGILFDIEEREFKQLGKMVGVAVIKDTDYTESADDYLNRKRKEQLNVGSSPKKTSVQEWLLEFLSDGPKKLGWSRYSPPEGSVHQVGRSLGFSASSIDRAVKKTGLNKYQDENNVTFVTIPIKTEEHTGNVNDIFTPFSTFSNARVNKDIY